MRWDLHFFSGRVINWFNGLENSTVCATSVNRYKDIILRATRKAAERQLAVCCRDVDVPWGVCVSWNISRPTFTVLCFLLSGVVDVVGYTTQDSRRVVSVGGDAWKQHTEGSGKATDCHSKSTGRGRTANENGGMHVLSVIGFQVSA